MAEDTGIGVVGLQGAQQGCQRGLLGLGTGVGRLSSLVETALIADADTVGVVLPGMGTGHLFGAAYMQLAVAGDIVVVAAGGEAPGPVTGLEGLLLLSQGFLPVGHGHRRAFHLLLEQGGCLRVGAHGGR